MSHVDPSAGTASLRAEIVASEQARIDLLKYKLIAVATLGAVGLGVGPQDIGGTHLVLEPTYILCIIPFVCTFVDLLCWHNSIRILIIARYLISINDPYEIFINTIGGNVDSLRRGQPRQGARFFFVLEDWALHWSTITLSTALTVFGALGLIINRLHGDHSPFPEGEWPFPLVGMLGTLLSLKTLQLYNQRVDILFRSPAAASPPDQDRK